MIDFFLGVVLALGVVLVPVAPAWLSIFYWLVVLFALSPYIVAWWRRASRSWSAQDKG